MKAVSLFAALAGLLLMTTASFASPIVFTLGADPVQDYLNEDVGPYPGTLTNTQASVQGFFCLDEDLSSTFGARYSGTESVPLTPQEQEAAFLASLAMQLTHTEDGPISFAIWQIMGTLGTHPQDPAAQKYVELANYAYANSLICSHLLNQAIIFTPADDTVQRFISAVSDTFDVQTALVAMNADTVATPEPSTWNTAGLCLVLLCFRHILGRSSARS